MLCADVLITRSPEDRNYEVILLWVFILVYFHIFYIFDIFYN